MKFWEWLRPDPPCRTSVQDRTALQTVPARAVEQSLQRDGWLGRTAVSGGARRHRRQIVQAARNQAAACGLPCLVLTGCPDPPLDAPLFGYDPFPGHTRQETAFLLAQAAHWGQHCAADEVAFSLEAALEGWRGESLAEFAAASCQQLEQQAQQLGALPFGERAEFRRVYYLMRALRVPGPQRPGASLAALLDRGGGQVFLPRALHWAMALAEADSLPGVLVVAEDVPWGELSGLLPAVFHGRRMVVGADLPGELSDPDWRCLCSRTAVGVVFAHPNALSARKLAELYGETYVDQPEQNRGRTTAPLQPWNTTHTRSTTTHRVRQNQILPELLQDLAPGQAVVQTARGRCLCRFRAE